jgi:hypothetical protein
LEAGIVGVGLPANLAGRGDQFVTLGIIHAWSVMRSTIRVVIG